MADPSEATGKLLALSMLDGIGPATLRKIAAEPGVASASLDSLGRAVPALARALDHTGAWERALVKAEEQVELADRHDARILSPIDPEYPRLLAATKDDPFILFVRGQLADHPEKSVAIIGTREPTQHGEVVATRVTQFFIDQGWSIVSGLAYGCDSIAHRTAVEAKAHTIAVMAHGLHMVAPSKNKGLAESILNTGGALVSQYPFGRDAIPQQFVQRDKTQAGLAQGVVMVQSDLQGGSLHASRAILDYNRWLAIPYPTEADRIANASKVQANLLLADGAIDKKVELLRRKVPGDLAKLIILRSRDDYAACLANTSLPSGPVIPPSQPAMF
jgi:DNA processing protein